MGLFAIETLPDEAIQTPRLSLRAPRRSDLGELHRAVLETLPALVSWLPWARRDHGLRDTRLYLRGARLARLRRRALEFLVEDSESHDLLGIISLKTSFGPSAGTGRCWISSLCGDK